MQKPYSMYPTNYISQTTGRQFSMPDLTVMPQENSDIISGSEQDMYGGGNMMMPDIGMLPSITEQMNMPIPMPDNKPMCMAAAEMCELIRDSMGSYIFADIDMGWGHTVPIEGMLYKSGDDYFTVYDSSKQCLSSYRVNDIKCFKTYVLPDNMDDRQY